MPPLRFVCIPQLYGCNCYPGKIVSRRTAMRHRQQGLKLRRNFGSPLPHPRRIELLDEQSTPSSSTDRVGAVVPSANKPQCSAIETSLHSAEQINPNFPFDTSPMRLSNVDVDGVTEQDLNLDKAPASFNFDVESPLTREDSLGDSGSRTSAENWNIHQSPGDSNNYDAVSADNFGFIDERLELFLSKCGWLIGFWLKHGASQKMMDDLLKKQSTVYRSWKGVKGSILRSSEIVTSKHFRCSLNHAALSVSEGRVTKCVHKVCQKSNSSSKLIEQYEYIELWPRLKARLRHPVHGPELFGYYRNSLNAVQAADLADEEPDFFDCFSGSLFKDAVENLGGYDAVKDDLFLFLTTDGVQPFKSTAYSYWPVVVAIGNLHPSVRFKRQNILPITVIPGPKNPVDLTSFLRPFIEELHKMGAGIKIRFWDGQERIVRAHLLFCMGDIPAVTKLAKLLGHTALFACRFCEVEGIHTTGTYFPDRIRIENSENPNKGSKIQKRFNIRKLPLRTEVSVFSAFQDIKNSLKSNGKKAALNVAKLNGFSGFTPSPLIELQTVNAFGSFPIDLMHLLFYNIPRHWVSILIGEEGLAELAYISKREIYDGVDKTLVNSGSGISSTSAIRRPRSFAVYKMWKAAEWKFFVLSTSLVALHEWVPEDVLTGWHYFVQACELLVQWEISDENVRKVEKVCRKFYKHFASHYYAYDPCRLKLCRFIYHLLLHLADGVRACGPLSTLAQWSMEDFVGVSNRRCHAETKFGEAVAETVKLEYAARHLASITGHKIEISDDENVDESAPSSTSDLPGLSSSIFKHPKQEKTVSMIENDIFPNFSRMLARYYQSALNITNKGATRLIEIFPKVIVWKRLQDREAASRSPETYAVTKADSRRGKRASCYGAGTFRNEQTGPLSVYYGKCFMFIEHLVHEERHMLVLAGWVTSGLQKGPQNQVFIRLPRDSPRLFSSLTVESVASISYGVKVIESEKKIGNRKSVRTYFIDEMREPWGLFSGRPWRHSEPLRKLKGL